MAEYYPTRPVQPTSSLAIVSLVAGIATWFIIPVLGAVAAVITGHMAKREIRASGGALGGDGLATAGLVLGYLQLALVGCAVCAFIGFVLLMPGMSSSFSSLSLLGVM